MKADDEQITDKVGMDVLRTPAHMILYEPTHSSANGGFDFSLCSHGNFSPLANGEERKPGRGRALSPNQGCP
jgi:hypothetical protein